ncbi:MAG TPA: hypothetical protein VFS11_02655 [Gemmatimonadales bacterium]|nr:hypothetical protein [Gemmatimonadales bacterium]
MRHPDLPPDSEPIPRAVAEETGATPTAVPAVAPAEQSAPAAGPRRVHLVVVTTRPAEPGSTGQPGRDELRIVTRFWHPRERQWNERRFTALEHALHFFVDERGWTLRQQQALDGPHRFELIFEAPWAIFADDNAAEVLEDEVGLSPRDVAELVERVEERVADDEA